MALDPSVFETLTPSQYISFTLPNPFHTQNHFYFRSPFLRVSVLDSPIQPAVPLTAAMIVPLRRESDWVFSTFAGHLHLLLPNTSRLVLVANNPPFSATSSPLPSRPEESRDLEEMVMPQLGFDDVDSSFRKVQSFIGNNPSGPNAMSSHLPSCPEESRDLEEMIMPQLGFDDVDSSFRKVPSFIGNNPSGPNAMSSHLPSCPEESRDLEEMIMPQLGFDDVDSSFRKVPSFIGNNPSGTNAMSSHLPSCPEESRDLEEMLMPLVISLCPKLGFDDISNFRKVPFLSYYDGVVSSVVVELCVGSSVGEMLVEDVEIRDEFDCEKTEFRRRLRFKRTPNLVQTQIRIARDSEKRCGKDESLSGFLKVGILVQPYLVPMVASMSLVGLHLDEKIGRGLRPRALCLGVGGGALLSFLDTRLGFEVVGVEEDEAVLGVAKRRFGLPDDTYARVCIGDGIEFVKKLASGKNGEFDVVMVDLDSSEVGVGAMAPPMEFVEESVLFATRAVLCEGGIIVVNVIPASRLLYERMVCDFREVFDEVYEIDVGNEENFVLIASRNATGNYSRDSESGFHRKLREAISGEYMDSIKKI